MLIKLFKNNPQCEAYFDQGARGASLYMMIEALWVTLLSIRGIHLTQVTYLNTLNLRDFCLIIKTGKIAVKNL